jgi:hypothetical protein
MLGARKHARLLSGIDAFYAASKVGAASKAHLDKDDGRSVLHDQIDFTVSAAIVSCYQAETVIENVPACEPFGPSAELHSACTSCVHC